MTNKQFMNIRIELDLSQEEVGKKLGTITRPIPKRTVRSWEDGNYPVPPMAENLMYRLLKDKYLDR